MGIYGRRYGKEVSAESFRKRLDKQIRRAKKNKAKAEQKAASAGKE